MGFLVVRTGRGGKVKFKKKKLNERAKVLGREYRRRFPGRGGEKEKFLAVRKTPTC